MKSGTCDECSYWVPLEWVYGEGQCRLHGPVVMSKENGGSITRFPITDSDAWCGDFHFKTEGGDDER